MSTKNTSESVKDVFSKYMVQQVCGFFSFERDYVSRFQLIKAAEKLVKEDPKILRCVVRNSGDRDNVEFVYEDSSEGATNIVINKLKEFFLKELNLDESLMSGDLMPWRYSVTSYSYVIKA